MKTWLLPIFLLLAVLMVATPIRAFAEEQVAKPVIEVPEGEQLFVGNYPIKIYVYPEACEVTNVETMTLQCPFQCSKTQEIIRAIYGALHDFHHIVIRFIDEYPEYRKLALIYFVNASTLDEADIVVGVIGVSPPKTLEARGYILSGPTKPWRIYITCDESVTEADFTTTFMHELLHALGLNHAKQPFTDDGSWELMYPAGERNITIYPSTLDLYALYMVHFCSVGGDVVTLPRDLKYEMVIPYGREIQILKQENQKLRDQLGTSTMLFEKMQRERDALRDKLSEVNATLQDLSEQYQAIRSILDSYIRAYNSLQQKYENLRGNCSLLLNVCNATYHELSAKLAEKHAALVNMMQQYNQCAAQFNRLYEEHQALVKDYDDLAGRFTFLAVIYFAVVAILGGGALWVSIAYGRLRGKYHELLERLEGGEEHE